MIRLAYALVLAIPGIALVVADRRNLLRFVGDPHDGPAASPRLDRQEPTQ